MRCYLEGFKGLRVQPLALVRVPDSEELQVQVKITSRTWPEPFQCGRIMLERQDRLWLKTGYVKGTHCMRSWWEDHPDLSSLPIIELQPRP